VGFLGGFETGLTEPFPDPIGENDLPKVDLAHESDLRNSKTSIM